LLEGEEIISEKKKEATRRAEKPPDGMIHFLQTP
jgi:hypothetical protein